MPPTHYAVTRAQLLFSAVSIAAAFGLLAALALRVVAGADVWQWWVPLALAGGIAAADLGSGLVHWAPTPGGATTFR